MCGILGIVKTNEKVNLNLFNQMRDTLFHRGPDGAGTEMFYNGKGAFGHRRLSIIDITEKAKQPMYDFEKEFLITYNGEIYNYKKIKRELEVKGYKFQSMSDTEVVLYAFKEWGIDKMLSKLKGMFAFSIYDKKNKFIYLARDRFGMKPLCYFIDDNKFIFASELKAIIKDCSVPRKINQESLADFFIYSYVPAPHCIWEKFYKLEPSHYMIYSLENHNLSKVKYWELAPSNKSENTSRAIEVATEMLNISVKEHFESDVPVGVFLSGGYDSSSVLMHANSLGYKPNTFSLGFSNSKRSEHKIARLIANKFETTHNSFLLQDTRDYLKDLIFLSKYYDEPYAISSMLTYYYVSKEAVKKNKVVLAGDGGDELYAGYKWDEKLDKEFNKPLIKRLLKRLKYGKEYDLVNYYSKNMTGVSHYDLSFLNKELQLSIKKRGLWYYNLNDNKKLDVVKRSQILNFNTFIPQPALHRADMSSMINSLEVRVPFLDHELFEYIFSLKSSIYYERGVKKKFLEEKLRKQLPSEVFEMPKYGFSFQFLEKIFNKDFEDIIKNGELRKQGLINFKKVKESNKVCKFHLLMLELWFKNYG